MAAAVGEAAADRGEGEQRDTGHEHPAPAEPVAQSGEAYNTVQRKIHALINGAADVSKWAVDLGADGLEPEDHTLTVDGDDTPLVRLHCAFSPDIDDRARIAFMTRLASVMANAL
ncbi:hypothetical protein AB0K74_30065 [Streptomyces sp. NPDC056159]|uniref:hypothetical protein n=1 Tax=Streptomyces sp. NPDC056159 TaxID=3155537 RepID=UPI003443FBE4